MRNIRNIKQLRFYKQRKKPANSVCKQNFSHDFGETRKKPNARHLSATGDFGNRLKIKQLQNWCV